MSVMLRWIQAYLHEISDGFTAFLLLATLSIVIIILSFAMISWFETSHQGNPRMSNARFLTTRDVARYCQVSRSSVCRWIKEGKLRAFATPGGHYRISQKEFKGFLTRYGMPISQEYARGPSHDAG